MRSTTILCVDDDASIRELYRSILGSFGWHVLLAENGNGALKLHHSNRHSICAVILDYQMPGMNGVELAARLKQFDPNLPVVLISGSHDLDDKPEAVDLALPKGLPIEKLLMELDFLIRRAGDVNAAKSRDRHAEISSAVATV